MDFSNGHDRRNFMKVAGAAALGSAFGSWELKSETAKMIEGTFSFGHFSDTFLSLSYDKKKSSKIDKGFLFGNSLELRSDIEKELLNYFPDSKMIIMSGGIFKKEPFTLVRKPPQSIYTESDLLSYDQEGIRFIHIPENGHFNNELSSELDKYKTTPTILVTYAPLTEIDRIGYKPKNNERDVVELLKKNNQVFLVLSGKVCANHAELIPGTDILNLVTCSTLLYPCGARGIKISIDNKKIVIISQFIQTRRTDLVEESFHRAGPPKLYKNLGQRKNRNMRTFSRFEPAPVTLEFSSKDNNLNNDAVNLCVLSDIHLCLDKYMTEKAREEFGLIGHFAEEGSKAIFGDILDQVAKGRHRVEFYDDIYSANPDDDINYADIPVDTLLLCGDLMEHGKIGEEKLVLDGLAKLPDKLRENTITAIGNHDLDKEDFAPDGVLSSRDIISDIFKDYLPEIGKTNYVVPLTNWCNMIVLDTVIASMANCGMHQDQLDWLEDALDLQKDKTIIIASHHPLYHLTQVPQAMYWYLRSRSHFTPPRGATRVQAQDIIARHPNVKMVISGHYHGVSVDQFMNNENKPVTHVQVPCTVEYPNGYRLFQINRDGGKGSIEWTTAYTRLANLRQESSQALIYKLLGTKIKPSKKYKAALDRIAKQDNLIGHFAALNPYDLPDLNMRGFKDGTANRGRGNSKMNSINGIVEFDI